MTIKANSISVNASITATDEKAVTGFNTVSHKPELRMPSMPIDAAVYNHPLIAQYTLAAAGTQVVDLYSVVTNVTGAVTITKFKGILITATAVTLTGGQLRIERDATDGWAGLFDHASDKWTLDVGGPTDGLVLFLVNGATKVVSNTSKRILFTNPGTQSILLSIYAILGT